eukprot:1601240-Rhodomonas_salina.1
MEHTWFLLAETLRSRRSKVKRRQRSAKRRSEASRTIATTTTAVTTTNRCRRAPRLKMRSLSQALTVNHHSSARVQASGQTMVLSGRRLPGSSSRL